MLNKFKHSQHSPVKLNAEGRHLTLVQCVVTYLGVSSFPDWFFVSVSDSKSPA